MRGGEKVLLSLVRLFPDAPIFTLLHVRGSVAPELESREIRTTFVQHLPDVDRRYRSYLPLFPAAAGGIDLRGFDLVVSSSHCVAKGVRPAPGALHLCYCHTPMRYVWDRYSDYFGSPRVSPVAGSLIRYVAAGLRAWDTASAARVHRFVANSRYVAGRIRRYYGRESEVIPPPVDTEFFTPGPEGPGEFDLLVSALAPYKRVDMALEAYRGTGRPLRIVGTGPEREALEKIAPPEASFLGWVDDPTLRDLYRRCRVALMLGVEDFGIVPLEAMACGRPAIVFDEGGGRESVVPGETGMVFGEATPQALRAAVDSLEGVRFNGVKLRARAEAHSRRTFESRFRAFVERAQAEGRSAALQPA
jgi:glycosyltransferase involved in cell wall biosynthesis